MSVKSFSIECECPYYELCSVDFKLMTSTGGHNVDAHKLKVNFVHKSKGKSSSLHEFKSVTRVRFMKNDDNSGYYSMQLFHNSPGGGTKVAIDHEFLYGGQVNRQKRFRFLQSDVLNTSSKWENLDWKFEEEDSGSWTATTANSYIPIT